MSVRNKVERERSFSLSQEERILVRIAKWEQGTYFAGPPSISVSTTTTRNYSSPFPQDTVTTSVRSSAGEGWTFWSPEERFDLAIENVSPSTTSYEVGLSYYEDDSLTQFRITRVFRSCEIPSGHIFIIEIPKHWLPRHCVVQFVEVFHGSHISVRHEPNLSIASVISDDSAEPSAARRKRAGFLARLFKA